MHKLQFTPEELQSGQVEILNHFHDFLSNEGVGIGLCTYQNGINTLFDDFQNSSQSIDEKIPGDGLRIYIYTPTHGIPKDVKNTQSERKHRTNTPEVISTRQAMIALSETLGSVSKELLWLHTAHSRGGVIGTVAIEGMTGDQQKALQEQLIWFGIAPADPLKKKYALDSLNIWSDCDNITGFVGKSYERMQKNLPDSEKLYEIQFVPCSSKWSEWSAYIADHAILGTTYQKVLEKGFGKHSEDHGFYRKNR